MHTYMYSPTGMCTVHASIIFVNCYRAQDHHLSKPDVSEKLKAS